MSRNVTIRNSQLELTVSTLGAEIQSIKKGGREYLWQGDRFVWSGRAPVLFPICGGLKDGRYIFDERRYKLEKHGFAKSSLFKLESHSNSRVTFLLTQSEETLISYPFEFELRVSFGLIGESIKISYDVKNKSDKQMYFSCGAHEGFALPNGLEGTEIVFDMPETLNSFKVKDGLLGDDFETVLECDRVLPLKKEYFAEDALIFKTLASRSLTLLDRNAGRRIRIDFEDFEHLLIWQVCGADFICIEPWTGLPDSAHITSCELKHKESITSLAPGESTSYRHKINIIA